ncbi:hypothetical protein ACFZAU_28330 [Streptomyces sp. NPDC008238]
MRPEWSSPPSRLKAKSWFALSWSTTGASLQNPFPWPAPSVPGPVADAGTEGAGPPDRQHPLGETRRRRGLFVGLFAQRVAHQLVDVHGRTSTGE